MGAPLYRNPPRAGLQRPYGGRVQDAEMVEAILAGREAGMAAAYDQYAPGLYGYCRSLLGEPADAADVVQDTFIVAAGRLGGLRDPSRLRPWLYAVARNECRRRLRARASSVSLDEAAELTDDTIDLSAEAEKAELRALVSSALAGLNPGDREIIELNLRHDLAGRDLAGALGVRPNQAHALASRARSQFETSLGALLVARTGRESCADLAAILAGWDGQLNVLLRKRINRHIERCPHCRERKQRELSPAMLLGMLPVALLPASLRDQLLGLISDFSPGPSVYRASVIHRAGPFGQSGFPRPLDPPHVAHGPVVHAATVGAGAAAVAVIAAGILYATHGKPHAPHPPGPVAIGPSSAPGLTPSAPPGTAAPRHSAGAGAAPGHGTLPLGRGVAATAPVAVSASGPGPGQSPPPVSQSPAPPAPSSTGQGAGTLISSTATVTLRLGVTGSFTLTAQGGPVSGIQVQNPDPLDLTISLGVRSLSAGASTTVHVTMVNLLSTSRTLIVNPGGLTITVRASGLLG
jgi:RNA polymerase sigma factor (sigma-70 family)